MSDALPNWKKQSILYPSKFATGKQMTLPAVNPYVDALIQIIGGIAAVLNIIGVVSLLWLKTQYKRVLAHQKHTLDIKFFEHETALRAKHDKETELFRAELQRAASERQLLFSTIYQKREEILRDLYRKLSEAIYACDKAHRPGKTELVNDAQEKMRQLHTEMESVAIYFTETFCRRWHEHVEAVATALGEFKSAAENETQNIQRDRAQMRQAFDEYIKAWKAIRTDLRSEIRKLIGILNTAS